MNILQRTAHTYPEMRISKRRENWQYTTIHLILKQWDYLKQKAHEQLDMSEFWIRVFTMYIFVFSNYIAWPSWRHPSQLLLLFIWSHFFDLFHRFLPSRITCQYLLDHMSVPPWSHVNTFFITCQYFLAHMWIHSLSHTNTFLVTCQYLLDHIPILYWSHVSTSLITCEYILYHIPILPCSHVNTFLVTCQYLLRDMLIPSS